MRKPNVTCSTCGTPVYRRPTELARHDHVYCCRDCYNLGTWGRLPRSRMVKCLLCGREKVSTRRGKQSRYCSVKCSNIARRGVTYGRGTGGNLSKKRLVIIEADTGISHCMVEGCSYSRTLDVHRLIPGHRGGEYEIGNMFSICPNHHAEHTRGFVDYVKINNYTLRTIEKTKRQAPQSETRQWIRLSNSDSK